MKKRTALLLTAAMAGVLSVGGISAYFADGDTVTNRFTVGKVSLDLQEPDWDPDQAKNIVPMQTLKKNPQIKNDGKNAEYVFAKVSIPYANVVVAEEDGSRKDAADTELFHYNVNAGWTELGSPEKNEDDQTVTHYYVYGSQAECTRLEPGVTTKTLFDTVTFVNVVEDQELEVSEKQIDINAYGIQADYIAGGKFAPKEVWSVLKKQNPSVVVDENENPKTDSKES